MDNISHPGHESNAGANQRTYIRLKSIYPVAFAFIRSPEDQTHASWQQGYTRNIGKGGICLEMIPSGEKTLEQLHSGATYLELSIGIPLSGDPVKAKAKITWSEQVPHDDSGKYLIGLEFTSITPKDRNRMVNYARWVRSSSYAATVVSMTLFVLLVIAGIYSYRMRLENETLVNRLVAAQQEEKV